MLGKGIKATQWLLAVVIALLMAGIDYQDLGLRIGDALLADCQTVDTVADPALDYDLQHTLEFQLCSDPDSGQFFVDTLRDYLYDLNPNIGALFEQNMREQDPSFLRCPVGWSYNADPEECVLRR